MRLSRVFGILSLLMFILAILSLVLPAYSILSGVRITTNGGNNSIPTSVILSNNGFLPVNDISLMVTMTAPNGTTISKISLGPLDVPAGQTVPLTIAQSGVDTNFNNTSGLSYVTLQATATVNLGGLIPVSVAADFRIVPSNSTNPGGSG
jgi:hypothetical protein